MHTEKNICDNVLGTLLNINGKTKDIAKARKDLCHMGICRDLHLQTNGTSISMPHAKYTLSKVEKASFFDWLQCVMFPDGYASNTSHCVNTKNGKISGIKSHDCHVLLQCLLPVAIRGYLSTEIRTPLIELCFFFKELCSRTLKLDVLNRMKDDIVVILCKLEMIFPPTFVDIMVHLAIYLPQKAKLAGPVHYLWMYPIERFMGKLKRFVQNRSHPEGSIAEGYLSIECLTFCSMYLCGIETRWSPEERNNDGWQEEMGVGLFVFSQRVRPLGAAKTIKLDDKFLAKARWYVLSNCPEIDSYIR